MGRMTIVELTHLSYRYPHSPRPALRDLCLTVQAGEFVAIAGANGSGKSTLCYALTGFVPHFFQGQLSGQVWIAGQSVSDTPLAELAPRAGLVFQSPANQLSRMKQTVVEEIAVGLEHLGILPSEMPPRIEAVMQQVGIAHLANRSPFSLSGGEQQRLAIAAILVMQPALLVLDEPTTQLDPLGAEAIFALLSQLSQSGTTIIVASHDLEAIARHAHRLLVLDQGHLLQAGPPQLLTDPSLIPHLGQTRYTQAARQSRTAHPPLWPPDRPLPITLESAIAGFPPAPCPPAAPCPAPCPPAPCPPTPPALAFESVSFAYPQHPPILSQINLTIATGSQVALLGQNGAGKTSLVKHLNGLLRPTQGRVWIGDRPTDRFTTAQLARSVGYGFQNPDDQLFCSTVQDEIAFGLKNLGLPPATIQDRLVQTLDQFQLTSVAQANPYDLTLPERKLLTLACVAAMDPAIIVLDEPTIGLDHRQTQQLSQQLHQFRQQGKTLILISHHIDFVVEHCDRLLVLQQGQISLDGSPEFVFSQVELLRSAGIQLPQITRLAMALNLGSITSVAAFLAAYCE